MLDTTPHRFPQGSLLRTEKHNGSIDLLDHSTIGKMWHSVNFFKQNKVGLNSEFSFSYTGYLTKAKELSLPYYLTNSWGVRTILSQGH